MMARMAGEKTKSRVLQEIAAGLRYSIKGNALYQVGETLVHVRFKSKPQSRYTYPYNINRNTLRADYELWICGDRDGWYLIPIDVIKMIYEDPQGYVDHLHPGIRVANVNIQTHEAACGTGGKKLSFSAYRNARLS